MDEELAIILVTTDKPIEVIGPTQVETVSVKESSDDK